MSHVSQIIRLIDVAAAAADRSPHTVGRWVSDDGRTYGRLRRGHDLTTRRAACIMQRLSDLWPDSAAWPTDIPRPAPTPDGGSEPPAGGAGSSSPVLPPALADAGLPARGSLSTVAAGPAGGGDPNPSTATCAYDSDAAADTRPPGPDSRVRNSGAPDAVEGPSPAPPAASLKRAETSRTPRPITASSAGGAAHPMAGVRAAQQAMRAAADAGDEDAVRRARSRMFAAAMRLRRDGRLASPDALCRALGVHRHVYDDVVLHRRGSYYDHHPRPPADSPEGRVLLALEGAGDVRFIGKAAA